MDAHEALALARRIRRAEPEYSVITYKPLGGDGVEVMLAYSTGDPLAVLRDPRDWKAFKKARRRPESG